MPLTAIGLLKALHATKINNEVAKSSFRDSKSIPIHQMIYNNRPKAA